MFRFRYFIPSRNGKSLGIAMACKSRSPMMLRDNQRERIKLDGLIEHWTQRLFLPLTPTTPYPKHLNAACLFLHVLVFVYGQDVILGHTSHSVGNCAPACFSLDESRPTSQSRRGTDDPDTIAPHTRRKEGLGPQR